jgi:5'(3')-deoxyribonucleotidase
MNIYLDMDDVVADWMGYARKYLRMGWQQGEMVPENQWNRLKDDQRMYSKLDLKEGARELVEWCQTYIKQNPTTRLFFLTAVPHNNDMPYSFHDKVEWAQKYFPGIPVFFGPYSHDKWIRCKSPEDILIDDRRSNNEEWIRAGGRAHLYRTWNDCKVWLENELGVL